MKDYNTKKDNKKGVITMIEKIHNFTVTDEKVIERAVDDEHIHLVHMVLREGEFLPEHYSNSNIYMVIVRGTMTIKLGEQDFNIYKKGDIVNIPYNTKMDVNNKNEDILEFFVIKSPHPDTYLED